MDTFAPEGHVTIGLYTSTEWMEQYFTANGIESEEKKIAVFLTVIGSKADYYKFAGTNKTTRDCILKHWQDNWKIIT